MSEIRTGEEQRDSRGRFTPGASGNPGGRPPGIKDKRTSRREELFGPILPDAIEQLRQAVSEGERWAVELVVTYLIPRPKPVDPEEIAEFEQRLDALEQMAGRH